MVFPCLPCAQNASVQLKTRGCFGAAPRQLELGSSPGRQATASRLQPHATSRNLNLTQLGDWGGNAGAGGLGYEHMRSPCPEAEVRGLCHGPGDEVLEPCVAASHAALLRPGVPPSELRQNALDLLKIRSRTLHLSAPTKLFLHSPEPFGLYRCLVFVVFSLGGFAFAPTARLRLKLRGPRCIGLCSESMLYVSLWILMCRGTSPSLPSLPPLLALALSLSLSVSLCLSLFVSLACVQILAVGCQMSP